MKRKSVAILAATGMVGSRYASMLSNQLFRRRPKYSAENSAHGDFELSNPSEEVYNKYIHPTAGEEPESSITCPVCDSTEVDRGAGYRGEYKCMNCGHFWRRR